MAKGNEIIVSSNPKGQFFDVIMGDTSKPGKIMMISVGVAPVGGRHTWVAAIPPGDALPMVMAVLLADTMYGKLPTDAYVAGAHAQVYVPVSGEEINLQIGEGTTQSFSNDRLMLKQNGNLTTATAAAAFVPFQCMEIVTAATVPYLAWCIRL